MRKWKRFQRKFNVVAQIITSAIQQLPKGKTAILTSIDRITQPITDFIRGNPIVSTAVVGIGTTGLITGVASVVRRKKAKKKKPRKAKKRRKKTARGRRRDRMFISKQKHEVAYVKRKRKAGKKITRKRYKTKKKARRFVKGSKEAKAFMAKLRRMKK